MKKIKQLSLICLFGLSLFSYSSKQTTTSETTTNDKEMDTHMHHADFSQVELDADLPIFQPSERTFTNYLDFKTSENIYIRQNTSMINKSKLIAYYKENLPKNGWTIASEKSSDEKFVVKKGDRYATIRLFEMKQADTISLAYSINLVRPKLVPQNIEAKAVEEDMPGMKHHIMHEEHVMMKMN